MWMTLTTGGGSGIEGRILQTNPILEVRTRIYYTP